MPINVNSMNEDFDQFSDEELNELKERFFQMKNTSLSLYFDVDDYDQLIDYFFEIDDIENIESAINYALEQHPGNYEFLLKKAHLLAMHGKDEQGLQILDDISSFGADPDYFMIRGTILSNLQKYREAIEEYNKASKQGQDLEEVYANIAFEYENLEQFDKAVEFLNKVLDINPDNEAALNEIGICYEMSSQSELSIVYFNQFIDKYPYSRSAWFNLAIAYNSIGKNNKAINAYEFSLAIDQDQPSALFNIANIYAGMEKHKKAIKFYRETLTKESPDAITHYYMGESYEKLDLYDDALNSYNDSHRINSDFHEAIIGLARCNFIIGKEEEAFSFMNKAVELEEPFPLFWSIRTLKLDEYGFYRLAKFAIIQLIKKHPNEALYAVNYAVLLSNHDISHSIKVLKDAELQFSETKNLALILFLMGIYQIHNDENKIGLENFEKAIQLNKDDFQNPIIQSELTNISHEDLLKLIENYKLL